MKTKPFNLEAAKRGEAICRADGAAMRFVAVLTENTSYPVLCVSPLGGVEAYTAAGCWSTQGVQPLRDLRMVVKTKTVWVIVIPSIAYDTEQEAMDAMPSTVLYTASVELPV